MKLRVIVTTDGQISIFSDEGTFAEGKDRIEAIMAALKAQGIDLAEQSPVEQHRHDHEGVHSHTHAGPHTHSH